LYTRAELLRRVGHLSQVGGVQLLVSDNGPSRGVRQLEFHTGTGFTFKVAVERGMDVGYCEYQGASLAWIPPTLLAGPWYFEQQTEFGWLRTALGGFDGLYTNDKFCITRHCHLKLRKPSWPLNLCSSKVNGGGADEQELARAAPNAGIPRRRTAVGPGLPVSPGLGDHHPDHTSVRHSASEGGI
jgi:hypothetical protein